MEVVGESSGVGFLARGVESGLLSYIASQQFLPDMWAAMQEQWTS